MRDFADGSEKKPHHGNDRASEHASVLVVGAGPTGLLLAAELQRRSVQCHLIDARPGPLHWDRATVIHPRSLEVFESLGLIGSFLEAGTKQRGVKIYSRGQVLGTMDLSTCGSSYGFNLGLSEEVTESILTDYLHEQGGKVNRSSRLVGLMPDRDRVLAEIERDGHRYQVDTRWVVGCDGVHSPTRDLSGIVLEGHDIAKPWAVFDATLQGWAEAFDVNFVYLDPLPVILTALPGTRWRVYLRPSSAESDLVAEAASTVRRYEAAASFVDVENPTRFQCHTKVASQFRSGRVLLAGDAAHLCSPAEGHGMNGGLQDAVNLAWKLALVYQGAADPALLDSYEAERRPVAEMVTRSGDVTEHAQMLTDPARTRQPRPAPHSHACRSGDPASRSRRRGRAERRLPRIANRLRRRQQPSRSRSTLTRHYPGPAAWHGGPCRLHELTHRAGHTLVLLSGGTLQGADLVDLLAALQEIATDSHLFELVVAFGTRHELPDRIGYLEPTAVELSASKVSRFSRCAPTVTSACDPTAII